eukprot:3275807-Rhodomonas_salina.1
MASARVRGQLESTAGALRASSVVASGRQVTVQGGCLRLRLPKPTPAPPCCALSSWGCQSNCFAPCHRSTIGDTATCSEIGYPGLPVPGRVTQLENPLPVGAP